MGKVSSNPGKAGYEAGGYGLIQQSRGIRRDTKKLMKNYGGG